MESNVVAVFTSNPLYDRELGRLERGYSILDQDTAQKWIDKGFARLATPSEVAAAYL